MRKHLVLLVALGLMAAFVLVPSAASARAEFTEYTGVEIPSAPPVDFTCKNMDAPVLRCSQTSFFRDVTTDPRTTGFTTVQANIKTSDFMNGHIWGKFRSEPDAYDGAWEGTWTGKLIDGVPIFKIVGHGTGELEGLKVKADMVGSPEGILITGRILDPHG